MIPLLIFGVLTAMLAVIFAVQNTGVVTVRFLHWHTTASLAVLVIAVLAAGVMATLAMVAPYLVIGKWTSGDLKRKIAQLEDELKQRGEAGAGPDGKGASKNNLR